MMKKICLCITMITIIFMSLAACSSYQHSPTTTKAATATISKNPKTNTKMAGGNSKEWQEAYTLFLKDFTLLEDYEICEYALRDVNADGVPELILLQSDRSAKALLEIYSFKDGIFKTGEYKKIKVGSALRVSDNPQYPGLFEARWGGGIEHYGYITVEENVLVYEYLWFDNLAPEELANEYGQPGKNRVSDNKELIELSEKLFSDESNDNILQMVILGEGKVQSVIDQIKENISNLMKK